MVVAPAELEELISTADVVELEEVIMSAEVVELEEVVMLVELVESEEVVIAAELVEPEEVVMADELVVMDVDEVVSIALVVGIVRLTPAAPPNVAVISGSAEATGGTEDRVVEMTAVDEAPALSC